MKTCFKCKQAKPLSAFYKHPRMADGRLGKCATCAKEDARLNLQRQKQNPAWLHAERERCRLKMARIRQEGRVLISHSKALDYKRKWAQNNRQKRHAQAKAAYALRSGKLVHPGICQACAKVARLEMHHPDYSKPLEVLFLCKPCHGRTRRKS